MNTPVITSIHSLVLLSLNNILQIASHAIQESWPVFETTLLAEKCLTATLLQSLGRSLCYLAGHVSYVAQPTRAANAL